MKLLLVGLILVATSVQANCDLYIPDSLALLKGEKKDEKILDHGMFQALKEKGYNPILLRSAKRPITSGQTLAFNTTIVEKPAFLKKGLAALHFKMVDQQTKKTTYTHLHGVSCKYSTKKDAIKFEKDCMEHLKAEIEFFPACGE